MPVSGTVLCRIPFSGSFSSNSQLNVKLPKHNYILSYVIKLYSRSNTHVRHFPVPRPFEIQTQITAPDLNLSENV